MPLARGDAFCLRADSQLLTQRRLNAVAIEQLALNLRGLQGFVTDKLDPERVLIVRADKTESADEFARSQKKSFFQFREPVRIV